MRVGIGYDVHSFEEGRPLILGGVPIPHTSGLGGHSDGDVLTHAIIDALLGAAGLGDIGQHFPPGDPQFFEALSLGLLEATVKLLAEAGHRVDNVDTTVIAESPQVAPHSATMRAALGGALGIEVPRISIKATTTDRLGSIGRGEGIAALAVALLDST